MADSNASSQERSLLLAQVQVLVLAQVLMLMLMLMLVILSPLLLREVAAPPQRVRSVRQEAPQRSRLTQPAARRHRKRSCSPCLSDRAAVQEGLGFSL